MYIRARKAENPPRILFASRPEPKPHRVPEWKLQAAVVADLHKAQDEGWDFEFAGDMNGVRMSPSQAHKAKLTGMTPGESDLRFYLPGGRLGLIELKAKGGRLSGPQKDRHARLGRLGHPVATIVAENEKTAVRAVREAVRAMLDIGRKTLH